MKEGERRFCAGRLLARGTTTAGPNPAVPLRCRFPALLAYHACYRMRLAQPRAPLPRRTRADPTPNACPLPQSRTNLRMSSAWDVIQESVGLALARAQARERELELELGKTTLEGVGVEVE